MHKAPVLATLVAFALAAAGSLAAQTDSRTAAGQLAACGGAGAWNAIGYLDFTVTITSAAGVQGPFTYGWDRHDGLLRFAGQSPAGTKIEAAVDLRSRTGGAWENGKQLTGKRLADAMTWVLQRFGEDVLWLTFPLDWGQPGVTVTALPDTPGDGGVAYPTVNVKAPTGVWKTMLDPATGLVYRTMVTREGHPTLTVTWGEWQKHGGVFFAGKRTIAETGETVAVEVTQAAATPPPGTF
jgi:hypothetical protein